MNKFLERHKLPKFTQEEIDTQDRPVFNKKFGFVIQNIFIKKNLVQYGFTGDSTKYLRKK